MAQGLTHDMTEEERERILEERYLAKLKEQHRERIQREGFEIPAYDVEPGQKCEKAVQRKIKGRWGTAPCGAKALVVLHFAGPQNPDGTRVALCRSCIGGVARDMIGYLEQD